MLAALVTSALTKAGAVNYSFDVTQYFLTLWNKTSRPAFKEKRWACRISSNHLQNQVSQFPAKTKQQEWQTAPCILLSPTSLQSRLSWHARRTNRNKPDCSNSSWTEATELNTKLFLLALSSLSTTPSVEEKTPNKSVMYPNTCEQVLESSHTKCQQLESNSAPKHLGYVPPKVVQQWDSPGWRGMVPVAEAWVLQGGGGVLWFYFTLFFSGKSSESILRLTLHLNMHKPPSEVQGCKKG